MAKAKVAASVKDYPGTRLQAHSQTRYSWVLPGLTVFCDDKRYQYWQYDDQW
jgi:hypothetical protein